MAQDHGTTLPPPPPPTKPRHQQPAASARLPARRGVHLRRRKLSTVRLGGKPEGGPKRGLFVTRVLRRMRLKWTKLRVLKRLKEYYRVLVKDLIEAGASMDSYHNRLLMETSIAVPVMSVGFK